MKSVNCLCQPVRGNRGAGNIIAVVSMVNKHSTQVYGNKIDINYEDFDSHDEETLALCVQRVADDLSDRFAELLLVGDQFCGSAILVPVGKIVSTDTIRRFDDPTALSRIRMNETNNQK